LLQYLREKPTAYLDEMVDYLVYQFDIEVSERTVFRTLERAGWSRKVASKHAKARSEALREVFFAVTREWDPSQVVAIDESAANQRSGDRKRGWAPIGSPAVAPYFGDQTRRVSVVPAMDINGYFAYEILQGGLTKPIFERFIEEKVIPQCNPWPQPRSIILMDNASAHQSFRVQALCEAAGIRLIFLPPYSPDYNPIEQTFRVLKSWVRRNNWMMESFHDLSDFLEYGILQCCIGKDFTAMYKRCGYQREADE
jgi:transposase